MRNRNIRVHFIINTLSAVLSAALLFAYSPLVLADAAEDTAGICSKVQWLSGLGGLTPYPGGGYPEATASIKLVLPPDQSFQSATIYFRANGGARTGTAVARYQQGSIIGETTRVEPSTIGFDARLQIRGHDNIIRSCTSPTYHFRMN